MNPLFDPPLYLQRYQFVIEYIKRNKPKKMVDLGCNDCTLLRKLKYYREIEHLAGIDIDSQVMTQRKYSMAPIPTDYLQPSDVPLTIELYQGSVTEKDPRSKGFDLVTSIELIEHLELEDVDRFTEVVFGYMAPAAVIVSTPNADFNPLLPGLKGFRHHDHKFEWTRAEFQRWGLRVCREFSYEVEFSGVGEAPPGQRQSIGFCSQIGVFQRLKSVCLQSGDPEEPLLYKLLYKVKYPSLRDNNVLQRMLVNEVLYCAENLKRRWLEETSGRGEEAAADQHREEEIQEHLSEDSLETGGSQRKAREPNVDSESLEDGEGSVDKMSKEGEVEREDETDGVEDLYRRGRSVCVPLRRLWACPKVRSLSKNTHCLKEMLLNDTAITLTKDGSAMVLEEDDDEEDDEEDKQDFDCAGTPEGAAVCRSIGRTVECEDWDAELFDLAL